MITSLAVAAWEILLELAPWLLLGAAISGLLHAWLPSGFVHRWMRGRGGILRAVLLGVPLPLCSCGVIPAGVGLKRDGASDGASIAFMVSTPQTGVDSILVAASFLGWPFALFKVGAAALTGVVAGGLVEVAGGVPVAVPPAPPVPEGGVGDRWRAAVGHADEVVRSIWGWLVVGVLVSAVLQVALPADALGGTWLGNGVVAGLAVLVVSLPLYVCATASVPIAAGLLHAGLPPSAALVFLMAGPTTNVATVGAVHRTFGPRVLGLYLATVAGGALVLGALFDAVLSTTVTAHAHGAHTGWVATVAAVALLALFGRYAWTEIGARWAPAVDVARPTLVVGVDGMTCQGCARKVGEALRAVDGVDAVDVALEPGLVTVQGAASVAALHAAVRTAGFAVR